MQDPTPEKPKFRFRGGYGDPANDNRAPNRLPKWLGWGLRTGTAVAIAGEFFLHQNNGPDDAAGFQQQAQDIDSRRRQEGHVPVVRFFDSQPYISDGQGFHSGPQGRSWMLLDDLDPNISRSYVADHWGIPDGGPAGENRAMNDMSGMNIGYVESNRITNVFTSMTAEPWPPLGSGEAIRRRGGGPELRLNRGMGDFIRYQQTYSTFFLMGRNWYD